MKISVVIPAYNREKTIIKCLDTVVNQTYMPYEVIVVDDNSTDNTVKLVEEYSKKNGIVKIIQSKENGGAQRARNIGIKASTGDWIAFNDSDDLWYPDKLEKQKYAIEKSGFSVCAGGCKMRRGKLDIDLYTKGSSGNIYREMLLGSSYIMFQSLLIKKQILIDIGLLDENVPAYQELDTAIRIAKNNEVIYLNYPLFVYCIHKGDAIGKDGKKGLKGAEYLFEKFYDEIEKICGLEGIEHWQSTISYNLKRSEQFKKVYFKENREFCQQAIVNYIKGLIGK